MKVGRFPPSGSPSSTGGLEHCGAYSIYSYTDTDTYSYSYSFIVIVIY
jgi:hypothetical protein